MGLSFLAQGCGSALRQSSGAPVLSQCFHVCTGALWWIAALVFLLREAEHPLLVFAVAVSVLCWLGLWDSCLAHLPNGKWHLSWCLLSEGVVLGRWCYWPVSRALGWLNLFCTSAAKPVSCTVMLLGLEQQSHGTGHHSSLAALLKAPNWAVGAALDDASLEHPTGLSFPLGYQMMAAPFSLSVRWFVSWHHHSWLSLWLCMVGWSDAVWQGVIRMCCFTPAAEPSAIIHQLNFGLVLSGCQGGELPCGGCQLLSWHTVLRTVTSLAPAV